MSRALDQPSRHAKHQHGTANSTTVVSASSPSATPTANSTGSRDREANPNAVSASHHQHPEAYLRSMDGRQPEYSQSGLNSPYAPYNKQTSKASSADQGSAAQYQPGQDYKSSTFSSSATSETSYGLPQSARSGSFPEYIQRPYADSQSNRYPASAQSGMAQTSSPSPSSDGHHNNMHASHNLKSDAEVPIDPSIAQSSPIYPPPHSYSPYQAQHDMPPYAQQLMTSYGRPEWAGQYQQPLGYGHAPATTAGAAPNMVAHAIARPPAGGHPLSTVYSFVPVPGVQQHKRPRRRYEEIERLYECGWNGCDKTYGTLNHLNAHVTMQSHGAKRTPEEFKEIRKEWKAKKKEEENSRKAEEERVRQEAARNGHDTNAQAQPGQYGQTHIVPPSMGGLQLPPLGYQAANGQASSQYAQPQQVDSAQQYSAYNAQAYPQSPYAQGGLPYQQQQPHDQRPGGPYQHQ